MNIEAQARGLAAKSGFKLVCAGVDGMDALRKDRTKTHSDVASRIGLRRRGPASRSGRDQGHAVADVAALGLTTGEGRAERRMVGIH